MKRDKYTRSHLEDDIWDFIMRIFDTVIEYRLILIIFALLFLIIALANQFIPWR